VRSAREVARNHCAKSPEIVVSAIVATDSDTALDTYRYLRGGIPVMLVMLGVALIIERVRASEWLGSISAYYFTGAHAVFIGSICAMGTLLIVYKGLKTTEDVLLNLAGILAFVVAFVPTSRPETEVSVEVSNDNVISNVWALVIALLVARAASWLMYQRTGTAPKLGPIARVAVWVQRVLMAAGVLLLIVAPDWFVSHAHGIASSVLFLAIISTVVITAFVADKGLVESSNPQLYQTIYRIIAVLMLITLAIAITVHFTVDGVSQLVLWAEFFLLAEFGVYWGVQTAERWTSPTDSAPAPPQCTVRQERILDAL
jgi:hypothetical protein